MYDNFKGGCQTVAENWKYRVWAYAENSFENMLILELEGRYSYSD